MRVLYDNSTGEILAWVRPVSSDGRAGARGQQLNLVRALVRDVQRRGRVCGFWTFGTSWEAGREAVDKFCDTCSRLTRHLPGRWVLVIEAGSVSNRLHAHAVLEDFWSVEEAKAVWRSLTGLDAPHVYSHAVSGDPSEYVTKRLSSYMRKSAQVQADDQVWTGRRLFRSSKGLRRSLAAELALLASETVSPKLWREVEGLDYANT